MILGTYLVARAILGGSWDPRGAENTLIFGKETVKRNHTIIVDFSWNNFETTVWISNLATKWQKVATKRIYKNRER